MIRIITFIYDFLLILKAEVKRDYIYLKRYPLEIISFLFFMYIILLAVFFGFSQLTIGSASLLNREKMIIGYCLMQFAWFAHGVFSNSRMLHCRKLLDL